jgi:hypothetical protein
MVSQCAHIKRKNFWWPPYAAFLAGMLLTVV